MKGCDRRERKFRTVTRKMRATDKGVGFSSVLGAKSVRAVCIGSFMRCKSLAITRKRKGSWSTRVIILALK